MGNQASAAAASEGEGARSSGNPAQQAFRKLLQPNANALGLSKAELDERCRPSG